MSYMVPKVSLVNNENINEPKIRNIELMKLTPTPEGSSWFKLERNIAEAQIKSTVADNNYSNKETIIPSIDTNQNKTLQIRRSNPLTSGTERLLMLLKSKSKPKPQSKAKQEQQLARNAFSQLPQQTEVNISLDRFTQSQPQLEARTSLIGKPSESYMPPLGHNQNNISGNMENNSFSSPLTNTVHKPIHESQGPNIVPERTLGLPEERTNKSQRSQSTLESPLNVTERLHNNIPNTVIAHDHVNVNTTKTAPIEGFLNDIPNSNFRINPNSNAYDDRNSNNQKQKKSLFVQDSETEFTALSDTSSPRSEYVHNVQSKDEETESEHDEDQKTQLIGGDKIETDRGRALFVRDEDEMELNYTGAYNPDIAPHSRKLAEIADKNQNIDLEDASRPPIISLIGDTMTKTDLNDRGNKRRTGGSMKIVNFLNVEEVEFPEYSVEKPAISDKARSRFDEIQQIPKPNVSANILDIDKNENQDFIRNSSSELKETSQDNSIKDEKIDKAGDNLQKYDNRKVLPMEAIRRRIEEIDNEELKLKLQDDTKYDVTNGAMSALEKVQEERPEVSLSKNIEENTNKNEYKDNEIQPTPLTISASNESTNEESYNSEIESQVKNDSKHRFENIQNNTSKESGRGEDNQFNFGKRNLKENGQVVGDLKTPDKVIEINAHLTNKAEDNEPDATKYSQTKHTTRILRKNQSETSDLPNKINNKRKISDTALDIVRAKAPRITSFKTQMLKGSVVEIMNENKDISKSVDNCRSDSLRVVHITESDDSSVEDQ
ncbi:hypothetical protein Kpol_192p1, partial [Vanderwaltozyma polyspora DSM 70294]